MPDDDLWTVEDCEEQIAEAQYILDHPNEYDLDPSIREVARRSLGHYKRYLAYAKRIAELEEALQELAALAQREIEKNPALGIPHYRKGALARRALELAGGPLDKRHYDLVMRVRELEQALREIAAMDGATWYDDPSAGFAAVARRALGEEGESRA
jgi:hypothetical protein